MFRIKKKSRLIAGAAIFFVAEACLVYGANKKATDDPVVLLREFQAGHWKIFSVKNLPVTNGPNLTLAYPGSWTIGSVDRAPFFENSYSITIGNPDKKRREWIQVTWTEFPGLHGKAYPTELLMERFSPDKLKTTVGKDEKLIEVKSSSVAGVPAGLVETVKAHKLVSGKPLSDQRRAVNFWVGPIDVSVSLLVMGSNGEAELSRRMAAMRPVFDQIAGSITLPDVKSYQTASRLEFMFNFYRDNGYLWVLGLVLIVLILGFSFGGRFIYGRLRTKKTG